MLSLADLKAVGKRMFLRYEVFDKFFDILIHYDCFVECGVWEVCVDK